MYSRSQLTKFQIISIDNKGNSVQLMNLSTFDYEELSLNDFKYKIEEGLEIAGFYWNDELFIDQIPPLKKIEQNSILEDDDKAFV